MLPQAGAGAARAPSRRRAAQRAALSKLSPDTDSDKPAESQPHAFAVSFPSPLVRARWDGTMVEVSSLSFVVPEKAVAPVPGSFPRLSKVCTRCSGYQAAVQSLPLRMHLFRCQGEPSGGEARVLGVGWCRTHTRSLRLLRTGCHRVCVSVPPALATLGGPMVLRFWIRRDGSIPRTGCLRVQARLGSSCISLSYFEQLGVRSES